MLSLTFIAWPFRIGGTVPRTDTKPLAGRAMPNEASFGIALPAKGFVSVRGTVPPILNGQAMNVNDNMYNEFGWQKSDTNSRPTTDLSFRAGTPGFVRQTKFRPDSMN